MQTQKKKIRTQKSKEDNDFMNLIVHRKIHKKKKKIENQGLEVEGSSKRIWKEIN